MAAGSTYTPIATTTLGSSASSYTFTSIPQTYTDLVLVVAGTTGAANNILMQVGNGSIDTGTNYSTTFLYGDGSAAASSRQSNISTMLVGRIGTSQSINIFQIMNYANTTTYKTFLCRGNNATASGQVITTVNLWRSTSAINQIKVLEQVGSDFQTGTTLTLYGITAA
jgi:hypothetical protein